jgi:hypothetical protein
MTINGIEVDDTREDERADLIALAGRMARGEVEGYQGVKCDAIARALVDELGGALRSIVEEFEQAGTVRQIQGAVSEEVIAHARALLARLEP